jgi:hypothetical protein
LGRLIDQDYGKGNVKDKEKIERGILVKSLDLVADESRTERMCEYNDGDLFGVCIALVALVFKRCHFMTWEKREDIRHSQ